MFQDPAVPTDAAHCIRETTAIHQAETAHARIAANSGTGRAPQRTAQLPSAPTILCAQFDLLYMWDCTPENQVLSRMHGPISDLRRCAPVENSVSVPNAFSIR